MIVQNLTSGDREHEPSADPPVRSSKLRRPAAKLVRMNRRRIFSLTVDEKVLLHGPEEDLLHQLYPSTTTIRGGRATGTGRRRLHGGQKCSNLRITILCGVITVLVFRGTIGISLFSSFPETTTMRQMEETNRIIAEIRSDGNDNDNESVISSNDTYTLGPKILNWDGSRQKWLQEHRGFPSHVNGRPRILLVTGSQPSPCNNPIC
ncbi:UNVERIFIED_CONTAM: putative xyloglucan 6-xylosyltransferase 5 [Sesamum calycinum]|uniref:Xyloglucan 6-xylosyltransferase 5 n=1 Tax=Sesamum calycinum TaxID=2727403 RepID=A0AAW2LFS6_9LAMI